MFLFQYSDRSTAVLLIVSLAGIKVCSPDGKVSRIKYRVNLHFNVSLGYWIDYPLDLHASSQKNLPHIMKENIHFKIKLFNTCARQFDKETRPSYTSTSPYARMFHSIETCFFFVMIVFSSASQIVQKDFYVHVGVKSFSYE